MSAYVRLIGDIHGERRNYLKLLAGPRYTIQLGDFDFEYDWLNKEHISPEYHRIILGNHDNYDLRHTCAHSLGDYGTWSIPGFGDVFFVRGGWSIDWRGRTTVDVHNKYGRVVRRKNLWTEEELTYNELQTAIQVYTEAKPQIVLSHECPLSVLPFVTNPAVTHSFGYSHSLIKTRTNQALQAMLETHQPKLWVFGHYHTSFDEQLCVASDQVLKEGTTPRTRFVCLNILRYLDLPQDYLQEGTHGEKVEERPQDHPGG